MGADSKYEDLCPGVRRQHPAWRGRCEEQERATLHRTGAVDSAWKVAEEEGVEAWEVKGRTKG